MRAAPVSVLLAAGLLLAGCGGSSGQSASPAPTPTSSPSSPSTSPGKSSPTHRTGPPEVIGTVATDLDVPWGIAFLPDGSALVVERGGDVLHLEKGRRTTVAHVDVATVQGGESGLLGIAVSPDFDSNHRVFLYASTSSDNRILRGTLREDRLTGLSPILTGIPHGTIHNGGRLRFGPEGYLYASTGETGDGDLAQQRSSLGGKILRITESGKPAPGNPFPGSPIWTLGHRNVEGLTFDPEGHLWASEFGDSTWDELNLIRKGHNYGWPVVEGRASGHPDFTNPKEQWHTGDASPSGIAWADGSLWLAALRGQRLWQVPVHGTSTGKPKAWFIGKYGRLRTVVRAPDGNLWVTTSNTDGRGDPHPGDDRILVVRP